MSREIKFRAWDKGFGMMFYSSKANFTHMEGEKKSALCGNHKPLGSLYVFVEAKAPIMQFTGLTDKNGKEIWEGDIVEIGVDAYPVFYENGAVCVKKDIWFSDNESKHFAIIGNIYENGDLLK